MDQNDYVMTIEQVSKRLNKSVRTIHRYKDSGKLTVVVGESQGNPLFFSESEVEALAHELYPNFQPSMPENLGERLERVERVLSLLEGNPKFEKLSNSKSDSVAEARHEVRQALAQLKARQETREALRMLRAFERGEEVDSEALGQLLIRLGNQVLEAPKLPH
ncbi:MAG TPA: helix-turn-helix domain-containing protein [Oscillatoriaceae cyanobacterium]